METEQARNYCLRSMPYLKVDLAVDGKADLTLSPEDSPVLTPVAHGLLAAYVVDEGQSLSYVQNRHIRAAGLSSEQLHTYAIANLSAFAEKHAQVQQHGNIYALLMGGNFEASIILLEHFWAEWYAQLAPNGFVAAFPARDILAFGDASASPAIAELQSIFERTAGKLDHPLASTLYRRVGGKWEPRHG